MLKSKGLVTPLLSSTSWSVTSNWPFFLESLAMDRIYEFHMKYGVTLSPNWNLIECKTIPYELVMMESC